MPKAERSGGVTEHDGCSAPLLAITPSKNLIPTVSDVAQSTSEVRGMSLSRPITYGPGTNYVGRKLQGDNSSL